MNIHRAWCFLGFYVIINEKDFAFCLVIASSGAFGEMIMLYKSRQQYKQDLGYGFITNQDSK
jgi:hypothetical protein